MADRRWELDQTVTAAVIGLAALVGAVLGLVRGATQGHAGAGRVFGAAIESLGGALLAGFLALIVLSVAAAAWSLLVHVVRWWGRVARSDADE